MPQDTFIGILIGWIIGLVVGPLLIAWLFSPKIRRRKSDDATSDAQAGDTSAYWRERYRKSKDE